jgi:hypothetical protein
VTARLTVAGQPADHRRDEHRADGVMSGDGSIDHCIEHQTVAMSSTPP